MASRGEIDLDAGLEALCSGEVISSARFEPPRISKPIARKWIRNIGYVPSDGTVKLAIQSIERVRDNSELANQWTTEKDKSKWEIEVNRLLKRLKSALKARLIRRRPQSRPSRQTLAELIIEVSNTGSAQRRAELSDKLRKLKNPDRPVGGKGLNSLTPLHWVASRGLVPEALLLIERGATVDIELILMARPIGFAIEGNRKEMIKLLLASGAEPAYALRYAIKCDKLSCARLVFEHGVDLNAREESERTFVHVAAYSGAVKSLKWLAELKAPLETPDELGDRPLHYAAMFNKLGAARALIEMGAEVNATGSEGRTPLDLALEDGYTRMASFLRKNGGRSGDSITQQTRLSWQCPA